MEDIASCWPHYPSKLFPHLSKPIDINRAAMAYAKLNEEGRDPRLHPRRHQCSESGLTFSLNPFRFWGARLQTRYFWVRITWDPKPLRWGCCGSLWALPIPAGLCVFCALKAVADAHQNFFHSPDESRRGSAKHYKIQEGRRTLVRPGCLLLLLWNGSLSWERAQTLGRLVPLAVLKPYVSRLKWGPGGFELYL